MDLEGTIRERLNQAIEQDPRSLREIAQAAGVNYDHLRKYLLGQKGMSINSLPAVANELGVAVSWLVGGTRHLSGDMPYAPVVDSRSYPVNTPSDKLLAELERTKIGDAPNMSGDESAHWIRLEDSFGQYTKGDWVLVTPKLPAHAGDPVVALVDGGLAVGTLQTFRGEDCLIVDQRLYDRSAFVIVGLVYRHLRRTVDR